MQRAALFVHIAALPKLEMRIWLRMQHVGHVPEWCMHGLSNHLSSNGLGRGGEGGGVANQPATVHRQYIYAGVH
jgi:hypothetical protein